MQEMSALKQSILKMDDRQIAAILKLASQNSCQPPGPAPAPSALPDNNTPGMSGRLPGWTRPVWPVSGRTKSACAAAAMWMPSGFATPRPSGI